MKTILLVDDEYALVEILTDLLQSSGYRIVSATNGREALARCQEERPDLVITDFMMPIADGRELLQSMRARADLSSVPIVMMSATTRTVALATPTGALEVAAFIRKPAQWKKLLDVVVRLIGPAEEGQSSTQR
jgi:CheY-like chemotaxis protein